MHEPKSVSERLKHRTLVMFGLPEYAVKEAVEVCSSGAIVIED